MPALTPAVIDVPLSPANQTPSDTMGPLGRIQYLKNGKIVRYEPHYTGTQGVVPAKIRVEPRDAFNSLPATARSVVDGTVASPSWANPRLLGELDAQLVSICGGSIPRVWNGANWSYYSNAQVVTQKLSQDVFHTSQATIQAPDSAWMSGVTCSVWTQTTTTSTGALTTSYVGFKSDNGAWVVQPAVLFASSSISVITQARVVSDGSHFFVFYNNATTVQIGAYDVNGALLGTNSIGLPSGAVTPFAWDVTVASNTGGYTVLYAQLANATTNSGVSFVGVGWNGSAVIVHTNTDSTIQADWRISFLRNDTGNGLAYLATSLTGTPEAIWAYEVTNFAQSHAYNTGVTVSTDIIDSMTGYVVSGTLAVVISYSTLSNAAQSTGPKYDPQLRYMSSFQTTRGNSTTQLRTTQSLAQATRAFSIDGNYYVIAYYQSGSGDAIIQSSASVSITNGDYMIGAQTQPISVNVGDYVSGSPINATEAVGTSGAISIFVSSSKSSTSVNAGDSVVAVTSANQSQYGIPDGTRLLLWTFSGLTSGTNNYGGSRVTVTGASALNSTFEILGGLNYAISTTQFYTLAQDTLGNPAAAATFTAGGHFAIASMACYLVSDLSTFIPSDQVARFFSGGSGQIVVSGASGGGDNGTFAIQRIRSPLGSAGSSAAWPTSPSGINPLYSFGSTLNTSTLSQVWVTTTTQTQGNYPQGYTAVISPGLSNDWRFASEIFDNTFVGTDLVVSQDTQVPANVNTYQITSVPASSFVTTGNATSIISQVFAFPLPTVSIQLTTQVAYTFKLQAITPDYTYQNAIISVQDADNPANNGTYQIIQINADGTVVTQPTNGLTNQTNELFTGGQIITIYFATNNEPSFQSTWYLVPLAGQQAVAGRFEYGLAYADWRIEGDQSVGPDLFPNALSSAPTTTSGTRFVLPYRAQNVTSSVVQITAAGEVDIGDQSFSSTVGTKLFTIGTVAGSPFQNSGELAIPGPMATVFTPSGFLEDDINLAPEAPFLVNQSVASGGQLGLTLGSQRTYVPVWEQTDESGNRIYSVPGPALTVYMSGTNNVAKIGGRLPFPLNSSGQPVSNTFGPTTRNVTLSLYATAFINGVPTTQRYKITNDLNPNGLAPQSTLNPSGFSFPNSFTWNYVDQNPDSEINSNEILYTDKGYLPRYPAPAFYRGTTWKNREWVIGYDRAIWMSGEKTEGDAVWFNPAFRYVLPTDDEEPLGVAPMDDYLIIVCARSIWYIPSATFPDATGANGTLPTPVQLPFQNGSVSGYAQTIREGVAYDSTAGGVWLISRNLENIWLSHAVQDSLSGTVTGLSLDQEQRLFVQQSSGPTMVYDGIPAAWYEWDTPTNGLVLASYLGNAVYQDGATVNIVTPGQAADIIAGTTYGIAPDITLAPLNFGNVRGLKKCWEFQAVGTYLGPHRLNIVLSYPEDDVDDTTYGPFVVLSTEPYVYVFNPLQESASQFGVRLYADFVGVASPGLTFALEMISAQVGMETVGLAKRPSFVQIKANT